MPDPVKGTSLLLSTAVGREGDASWRRGVTILWALFGLIAVAELCGLVFRAFGGYIVTTTPGGGFVFWTSSSALVRLGLVCAVFFALWSGWNWTRWLLAVFSFLFGAANLIQIARLTDSALGAGGGAAGQPSPAGSLFNAPPLAAAVLYLVLAGYLAFSADVSAFTKHRRETGRRWVLLPVAGLLLAFLVAFLAFPAAYGWWLSTQRAGAEQFGAETVDAMGERWDPAVFTARSSERLLGAFPVEERHRFLQGLSPLGPLQTFTQETSLVNSDFDWQEQRFVLRGTYLALVRCTHGRARFAFALVRPLFGSWQVDVMTVDGMSIDPPPDALPVPGPPPPALK